jgi:hypothetical protein
MREGGREGGAVQPEDADDEKESMNVDRRECGTARGEMREAI